MKISKNLLISVSKKRKFQNWFSLTAIWVFSLLAILPLFFVFYHVVASGWSYINISFFTNLPTPVGEPNGGMANALLGSLIIIGMACIAGLPIGILTGTFLSEYGESKTAKVVRFAVDLLAGVPSIVAGLFIYTLLVLPFKSFSAVAGSAALCVLMLPVIVKSTEEILKLVPVHVREAGLALGLSRWRVTLFIILKGSIPSLMTGIILSIARIAGETAPLIFTAFNSQFWPESILKPMSSLPVQIYNYSISPFEEWHQQAWAGAFLLLSTVFIINVLSRVLVSRYSSGK